MVGKERYPGPPIWRWGVEIGFFPLENSVVYIPWQQEARWPEIGPKHHRIRIRKEEEGKVLFIY